jgi:PPOX class probable F420-dependent enzyme
MTAMTEQDVALFWREPNLAKLATINADGTPHLMPLWYLYDGRDLVMITGPNARKVRNIRRDPRVTVCIDRPTPPYAGVMVHGTARLEEVAYQELAVPMAVRYLGSDAGELLGARYAESDLVTIRVVIDHLSSWDFGATA